MIIEMLWHFARTFILWSAASLSGWSASKIFGLYFQSGEPHWYEHPAVVSAVVAGVFLLASKSYDHLRDWRKEKDEEEEEHLSNTERMQELTQKGWQTYLNEIKELHKNEIKFFQSQLMTVEIDIFRDRQIKHKAFGEIQRLHGRIRTLEVLLAGCDTLTEEPEPFEFKYQEQILEGVEDMVENFKRSLRNNIRAVSGAPDEDEE